MKNFLLIALSVLLLSVSLSSCYVDGPAYGYALYHPAPRYYSHGSSYHNHGWGGHREGWARSGSRSTPARTRSAHKR